MVCMRLFAALSLVLCAGAVRAEPGEISIPGSTAYVDPDVSAARVGRGGIGNWSTADHIVWGGSLSKGTLRAALVVSLADKEKSKLKLTIAGESREVEVTGTGVAAKIDCGEFAVKEDGYQKIELAGVSRSGKVYGDIKELVLSGPAAEKAFFNLKERRNCASVHLGYPVEQGTDVEWFYNELTPKTDPLWTYYEACGWHRGYFGIQVNSPTERRVIFSVWDSGGEAVDRNKVAADNRVKLLAKGDGVYAGDFGNEGTGGHSHLNYMWKTGETQRFLVTAKPDGEATVYTGYYFFNDTKKWGLIASFRAPRDGKYLHGLYSFNENFGGANGHLRRLCEFGNQWIKTKEGKWMELTTAAFTHDGTGGKDRRDFGAGVTKEGRFYLSNGGFVAEAIKYRDKFTRPATGKPPEIVLP
ncbi:MAG: DUF3472 domain-containing protein [Tepidisphaerales bacterium]